MNQGKLHRTHSAETLLICGSNLLRIMAEKAKSVDRRSLPQDFFTSIADLTFEQLSTLRHRGAFSTVSLTFAKICQLIHIRDAGVAEKTSDLLQQYYQAGTLCLGKTLLTLSGRSGMHK